MEKLTELLSGMWEHLTKGPLDRVVIACSEEDYAMGMQVKRSIFEDTDGEVAVKLIMGDKMSFDNGDEIQLEDGTITISYIHDGNAIVRPSVNTYKITYEKEENE